MEDSTNLGNYLLAYGVLTKLQLCSKDGNEKQSEKRPSLLEIANDKDFTADKAYYMINTQKSGGWLPIMLFLLLVIMCSSGLVMFREQIE